MIKHYCISNEYRHRYHINLHNVGGSETITIGRCNNIVSYEFIWLRRTCDYI